MTIRLLVAMLLGAWAVEAHAISINVKNCSGIKIRVHSFNNNDTIYFASYVTVDINNWDQAAVACATNTCKLKIYYGLDFSAAWMNSSYGTSVCAQSPSDAVLPTIDRCDC